MGRPSNLDWNALEPQVRAWRQEGLSWFAIAATLGVSAETPRYHYGSDGIRIKSTSHGTRMRPDSLIEQWRLEI